MYDVIVVGARCAGASLAMLLARKGQRVLLLDKETFPSDFIATHMVWPPGGAALKRWGIWDEVAAADPALCRISYSTFVVGELRGPFHAVEGVDYTFNLRRVKLDEILVRAARRAGAEVREAVALDDLLYDGDRVVGVVAHEVRTGRRFEERAALVVGADGKNSTVAKRVGARAYQEVEALTASYLLYAEDFPIDRTVDEVHTRPPYEYVILPTDSGLTVVNLVLTRSLLTEFRADVTKSFSAAYDRAPELGERLRASRPVTRVLGVVDLPNFYRVPYGEGWALVGDAGITRDPVRAQGQHSAFQDAELLATAIQDGLSGTTSLKDALAGYQQKRDDRTRASYKMCLDAARLEVPTQEAWAALEVILGKDPQAAADFRGLVPASIQPREFFARWGDRAPVAR